MLFTRIASFFAVSLTFGGLAVAKPTPIEERAVAVESVQQVVTNLQTTTNTVLPQLNNMAANNQVTEANVIPLINQLITAFQTAQGSLSELRIRDLPNGIEKRQASQLAEPVANIIKDTADMLQAVQAKSDIPGLSSRVSTLSVSMNNFVIIIGGLIPGLVGLLGGLLATVAGLLEGVGLGLLGGLLGILL